MIGLAIYGAGTLFRSSSTCLVESWVWGFAAWTSVLFILASLAIAMKYTLGHAEHETILETLEGQRGERAVG